MDETEVKLAIDKGKLPITSRDKFGIAFCIICSACLIAIGFAIYMNPNFKNSLGAFCGLSCGILYAVYTIWQVFEQKIIIAYNCALPMFKKQFLLDELLQSQEIYISKKEDYFTSYSESKGWFSYTINILYSESGFYINAIKTRGKLYWFSKDTANDIIDKIRELEAKL